MQVCGRRPRLRDIAAAVAAGRMRAPVSVRRLFPHVRGNAGHDLVGRLVASAKTGHLDPVARLPEHHVGDERGRCIDEDLELSGAVIDEVLVALDLDAQAGELVRVHGGESSGRRRVGKAGLGLGAGGARSSLSHSAFPLWRAGCISV